MVISKKKKRYLNRGNSASGLVYLKCFRMILHVLYKKVVCIIWLLLLIVLQSQQSTAQILKNETSLKLMKECVDCIYNLQFTKADEIYNKIKYVYPDHPAVLLLDGIIIYYKNFPLLPSSTSCASFEKDLRDCIAKCDIKKPEDEAEYLLTNLCARGMLLLFYSDNGLHKEVMPLATNTYKYLRRSFDYADTYPDFNYFTGLYNYYREAYPEAHPIYRTFAFIFPRGNKAKGLKELETASTSSIFLKAESALFLTYIYQTFEDNPSQATHFSGSLHELYPDNLEYLIYFIYNLLLEQRYEDAENMIKKASVKESNQYFKAGLEIFEGIVQEKKYQNLSVAQNYYLEGIKDVEPYGEFGNDFASYGYYGLSRLCKARGDDKGMRNYRKKANDLTDFKKDHFADKE